MNLLKKYLHTAGAVTAAALLILPAILPTLPAGAMAIGATIVAFFTRANAVIPVIQKAVENPPKS